MSTASCPSCGGRLEHAPDCGRIGRPCTACGAAARDAHSEPECAADCPLLIAAASLPYASTDAIPGEGAPEVQRFTARALALLVNDPELGPALGKRYELAVIALDLDSRPSLRGCSAVFDDRTQDHVGRMGELLAQSLGTLAQLHPERLVDLGLEVHRALARAQRASILGR